MKGHLNYISKTGNELTTIEAQFCSTPQNLESEISTAHFYIRKTKMGRIWKLHIHSDINNHIIPIKDFGSFFIILF